MVRGFNSSKEPKNRITRTLDGGYVFKGIEFRPFGKAYKILFPEEIMIAKDQIAVKETINKYRRDNGIK